VLVDVSLDDKYALDQGRIFLSGIQALVRVPFDVVRADRRNGLNTGTFFSGYQGSPLGGLDQEILRNRKLAGELNLHFKAGLNEELGATSVWGSQLAPTLPGANVDGVVGYWYGKNPGLDRASDALRHANLCGTPPTGGAIALVGDDPSCKSSTVPSASEQMLQSLHMPILFPGNVQEILDLGLHAVALSRASGLWVGFKVVTNVADAAGTAEVSPDRVVPVMPVVEWYGKPYVHKPNPTMLAPDSLISERNLLNVRLEIARQYGRLNGLNRVTHDAPDAWLGLIAPGKSYADLTQALRDLGLDDDALRHAGVRVMKVSMPWPLDSETIREFAAGLEEILIVEEKLPFLEAQIKDILYGSEQPPRIVGKRDDEGQLLLPPEGELDADLIARAVAKRLSTRREVASVRARMAELEQAARVKLVPLPVVRTPFFCSGCPHNSSTVADADALVGAGIGCHTMILLNPEGRGNIVGITQMGGEGAQWIGMEPFTDREHFVQNIGDGTFHHSGSLAVRAAVAAGVNITYKLFYNATVAMTGGQNVQGGMSVADLTRWFALEGVRRVIVTTEEMDRYEGVELSPIAELRPREDMLAVQEELSREPGVTVLIHDQACAAENRRKRKRGKIFDPPTRVWINERVCEGCGDCGVKSACLSVLPVETEFGRKTQIHQPSCNKDYSCLKGDCPSFLTVIPGTKAKHAGPPALPHLPDPVQVVPEDDFSVRMIGIGGTGVVTVSQILSMAAHLEGKHTWGLDQTGLSQKGGPVVSDVRISTQPIDGSNKVSSGRVDLYLGFDLLGAANPKNLQTADPRRTVAVVSTSAVPTGKMVVDTTISFPELSSSLDYIQGQTRADMAVFMDAQALSEKLFGDHMPANMVAMGAAFQRGALPISGEAMEKAIRLNGAAVEKNLAAFNWGRACVAAPDAVAALDQNTDDHELREPDAAALEMVADLGVSDALRETLALRAGELTAYQNRAYAKRWVDFVREVTAAERDRLGDSEQVTGAAARNLYKLMAFKDEYEVARLHLDAVEQAKMKAEFGPDVKYWFMLHPPLLRALGMKKKLKLGRWFRPFFSMLYASRWLRRTAIDPFGFAEVRRVERRLIGEYEQLVRSALDDLAPATSGTVVELLESPDLIRGYEDIKLGNVELWRERVAELQERLERGEGVPAARPAVELPITVLG
jgi:indolepyruvate ferredoxin oxidoreductase